MDPTAVTADHDANNNQSIAMVFYLLFFWQSAGAPYKKISAIWPSLLVVEFTLHHCNLPSVHF
jgi:hypothetical protein